MVELLTLGMNVNENQVHRFESWLRLQEYIKLVNLICNIKIIIQLHDVCVHIYEVT